MTRIALALSGGGAAALGHIPVLEALDELGCQPCAIAGTSMGALLAVAYAAGHSGKDLRAHVTDLNESPVEAARKFWQSAVKAGLSLWSPLNSEAALEAILPDDIPDRVEDLPRPVTIMVTDYYGRTALPISSGPLRPALAASIAIPGIFQPVRLRGRVCVDGGVSNNLPLSELPEADITIAVDAASEPPSETAEMPGPFRNIAGSMGIMMQALMKAQHAGCPPTIRIEPGSRRFGALDFDQISEILEAAAPAGAELKEALSQHLSV